MLKRPLKTARYFSSNLSFSPWQSVGSTWSRQVPVLSARYEYLTVENPSNLSSIRLVWQVSRIGPPFTEKKIETKIAAANAGCRNKMKARQRKISRQQLSSTLRQQENRNLKENNSMTLWISVRTLHAYKSRRFGHPPPPPPSTTCHGTILYLYSHAVNAPVHYIRTCWSTNIEVEVLMRL